MRMDIAAQASKSKPISHPLLGTLKQKEAFKLTSKPKKKKKRPREPTTGKLVEYLRAPASQT